MNITELDKNNPFASKVFTRTISMIKTTKLLKEKTCGKMAITSIDVPPMTYTRHSLSAKCFPTLGLKVLHKYPLACCHTPISRPTQHASNETHSSQHSPFVQLGRSSWMSWGGQLARCQQWALLPLEVLQSGPWPGTSPKHPRSWQSLQC